MSCAQQPSYEHDRRLWCHFDLISATRSLTLGSVSRARDVREEILGISGIERRRWNKDGRLPKSGAGSFRRGKQSISFNLHPPEKIAAFTRKSLN
jgi:hypothetical protein